MRFSGVVCFVAMLGPIMGFLDTGAVFVNDKIDASSYIMESEQLIKLINNNLCDGQKPVQLYQISSLREQEVGGNGTFINHVHYEAEKSVNELSAVCHVDHIPKKVANIDEISMDDKNVLVIVQEMPKFETKVRRDADEISDEFEKAKSLAAEAENDDDETNDQVHIFDDAEASASSSPDKSTNDSLFNTYQFFTTGIFMCMIVSFMLLFILINALSWVSSIDITYKSFDKQVDFEKKTE